MKHLFFLLFILFYYELTAQYTAIPDNNFEQALINQGIDSEGTLDGQVLTSDIDTITYLSLLFTEIYTLEGIEGFESLEKLVLHYTQLWELNLSSNLNLKELYLEYGYYLPYLDLSYNINLEKVICYDGILNHLNVSGLSHLYYLDCSVSGLQTLDLAGTVNLEILYAYLNDLNNGIDLSDCISLKTAWLTSANLPNIDVSSCTNLELLDIVDNNISSINLENNHLLKYFWITGNNVVELNLNNNGLLEIFMCPYNALETIYLQNGANELLTGTYDSNGTIYQRFDALNNPNLTCIFVDDATYCNENWVSYDPTSYFVETQQECDVLDISEEVFQQSIEIYPNPTSDFLSIASNDNSKLKNISIYNALGQKIIETNRKDNIDISYLDDGIYFVNVENSFGKILVYKVIKE